MARVAEYDGFLQVEDENLRESLLQVNENIRYLESKIEDIKARIYDVELSIATLETTKAKIMDTGTDTNHTH